VGDLLEGVREDQRVNDRDRERDATERGRARMRERLAAGERLRAIVTVAELVEPTVAPPLGTPMPALKVSSPSARSSWQIGI
jgi:hypothetical protein